jgi:hypothetical protein
MVAARERLKTVIRERGSARLLVEYGAVDLGRVEPRAMWEDLKAAGRSAKDTTGGRQLCAFRRARPGWFWRGTGS